MKTYNHTTYALLGILTLDCRTGYEIKQLIDQSLNHFWKISYGQIYPNLKKLVTDGLATVKVKSQDGKPDRKEYFLTTKGKEVLQNWLAEPLQQITDERNEVLLKLFFSRHQPADQTQSLLLHYKEELQKKIDTYKAIEEMIMNWNPQSPDATYWLYTLDYGRRTTRAAIEWCEATIEKIK
ncbi:MULTISPECIES: PadR family transcriptional regulator [Virgibacillus]|uniref:Transcriptional regulator n=1 Tax=Virgibacillus pantothenticus TaxID=1473 RepID=A0A0L0QRN0_VIRPA|nr:MULTISPECIES: PadR family transcriptional regulator [Virgibacillus]API92157.1 transcriptional regulator [Virgibacillus sp. 6R]KNE21232.1 transcriptional regulator [Virgibacillus pantothenticus]MBS7427249.1 PadR family transcriptional regulator [Virgibacillus sp. 19R1-5]MED3737072.1 PadR family transcriptional regulator [Virgibacillus pantothenticus]QTY16358.1 PadR family transcriptional regulator [Virgibacillus pantothenticus]